MTNDRIYTMDADETRYRFNTIAHKLHEAGIGMVSAMEVCHNVALWMNAKNRRQYYLYALTEQEYRLIPDIFKVEVAALANADKLALDWDDLSDFIYKTLDFRKAVPACPPDGYNRDGVPEEAPSVE